MSVEAKHSAQPQVLDRLLEIAPEIRDLAAKHRLRNVAVFGSVARREESISSDIDLLVDVEKGASYFDIAGFELEIESMFLVPVHAISRGGLVLPRDQNFLDRSILL